MSLRFGVEHLRNISEQEVIGFYHECHGPNGEDFEKWVNRMFDMLGPDDCKFLVRSRQPHMSHLWMGKKHYYFEPCIADAGRFSWGETAVKITNNTKLEAVRIVNQHEAVDSKGNSYKLLNHAPVVEGPPLPDYQGRWDLTYGDGDYGSGGKIAQNGEQLPGPINE